MDFVDDKYINLLSSRLEKFTKKNPNLYNCRCPICGDSKTDKKKSRGFFYQKKNNTNYKCHNCGINISFNNFLKFSLEKFKNGHVGKNFTVEEPKFSFNAPKFKKSLDLPKSCDNEKSKKYLEDRKIDSKKFYYAEKFKKWVNSLVHTFDESTLKYEEERIVIPFYYKNNLIGFQGRSINSSPLKYITIMLDDNAPKIYGYDDVDLTKPVYIVEGPFDSTFIVNSIAMCGADINITDLNILHPIYVYDNEPRNVEIHSRMIKKIESGNSIVIWPNTINQKDINDMVLNGHNVQSMLESNTYSGLKAKLKFNEWKKV
jgi:hypothetical protein